MGDDLNIKEKEEQEKFKNEAAVRNEKYEIKLTFPGNALYNFGKLLANSAYGQTLMANHDEQIEFINNVRSLHIKPSMPPCQAMPVLKAGHECSPE